MEIVAFHFILYLFCWLIFNLKSRKRIKVSQPVSNKSAILSRAYILSAVAILLVSIAESEIKLVKGDVDNINDNINREQLENLYHRYHYKRSFMVIRHCARTPHPTCKALPGHSSNPNDYIAPNRKWPSDEQFESGNMDVASTYVHNKVKGSYKDGKKENNKNQMLRSKGDNVKHKKDMDCTLGGLNTSFVFGQQIGLEILYDVESFSRKSQKESFANDENINANETIIIDGDSKTNQKKNAINSNSNSKVQKHSKFRGLTSMFFDKQNKSGKRKRDIKEDKTTIINASRRYLGEQKHLLKGKYIKIIADGTSQRDIDTAMKIKEGMIDIGIPKENIKFVEDEELFIAHCKKIPGNQIAASMEATRNASKIPDNYFELIDELQDIVGIPDKEMKLKDISDMIIKEKGEFAGRTSVAHTLVEYLLMEEASGLPIGWDKAIKGTGSAIRFLPIHNYYRSVVGRDPTIARYWNSNLLWHASKYLVGNPMNKDDENCIMMLYVGHDGNIDGLTSMLSLDYNDPIYGPLASPPNSALRFDYTIDGQIRSRFGSMLSIKPPKVIKYLGMGKPDTPPALQWTDVYFRIKQRRGRTNGNDKGNDNNIANASEPKTKELSERKFQDLVLEETYTECIDTSDYTNQRYHFNGTSFGISMFLFSCGTIILFGSVSPRFINGYARLNSQDMDNHG